MSKAKDEMRAEYRREDLGKGVRGKYAARYAKGTNLVLLDDKVAKAFPTAEAVNKRPWNQAAQRVISAVQARWVRIRSISCSAAFRYPTAMLCLARRDKKA
jgi:hypothetical protein